MELSGYLQESGMEPASSDVVKSFAESSYKLVFSAFTSS